jgi:extracellular factor (EF) 3-hydroxypalmitic acid methyl ester biosynthesis protein
METARKKKTQLIDTSTEVSLQEKAFLVNGSGQVPIHTEYASRYSLFFRYLDSHHFTETDEPVNLFIRNNDQDVELGPCRILYEPGLNGFVGRLVFLRDVYDMRSMLEDSKVVKLQSAFDVLPLIFARKANIKPVFKAYVADLKYDLWVYKNIFDELDSGYGDEPGEVKKAVQEAIIETEGPRFRTFFENKLDELKCLVDDFSLEEHQHHGYYFRTQLWDLILCCPFTGRATLKPRDYPGDSGLMRMIYLNNYQGNSTYAKLTHKHAVEHAASQSVRYRIVFIGEMLNKYQYCLDQVTRGQIKVLSVGCGAAFELKNILETPQDCENYRFTLLDQDAKALSEAAELVNSIGDTLSVTPEVDYVQGSVRTMLFSRKLRQKWGQFHFIYSLGLFDYLAPRVAKAVLNRLYQLLAPGGGMIIGNFHVSNASRYYMMYWGDWFLNLRTEEELRDIFDKSSNDKISILSDNTGNQIFLHIQKPKDA